MHSFCGPIRVGVPQNILDRLKIMLRGSEVTTSENVATIVRSKRRTGLVQGNNLSATPFFVVVTDLSDEIEDPLMNLLLYADGCILYASSRHHL